MRKKFLSLILVICLLLTSINRVEALKVAEAGDNVSVTGSYNSTRFVAGNKVDDKSVVEGIAFVAGNDVTLEGSSTYGFYGGNYLTIREKVINDLFAAGNAINIYPEANIGRDVYLAASDIKISGTIERNLNAGASSIDLRGAVIGGDANLASEKVILDENTVITGKLTYVEDANISGLDKAKIGSVATSKATRVVVNYNFMDMVYAFAISAIAAFIVMVVLFYILPKYQDKLATLKFEVGDILKTILIGLVTLVLLPLISIMAMFTGFLTPLALIALALFAISIYIAYLSVYYLVGKLITTKIFKKDNVYLAAVIGIVLTTLLMYIPVLGSFISFICLTYGLGLVCNFIKDSKK